MFTEIAQDFRSSVVPLVEGVVDDTRALLRHEIALAKSEIRQEVAKAKKATVWMGVGALMCVVALIVLSLAFAYGLLDAIPGLPLWAAFCIVGLFEGVAGILFLQGGSEKARNLHGVPRQTLESIKEDAQWLKNRV